MYIGGLHFKQSVDLPYSNSVLFLPWSADDASGPEKKIVFPSATDLSPKLELKILGLGMHPIFVRLGVFSPFFEKRSWKIHSKFVLLSVFLKTNNNNEKNEKKKKKKQTNKQIWLPTQIFRNSTWGTQQLSSFFVLFCFVFVLVSCSCKQNIFKIGCLWYQHSQNVYSWFVNFQW